MRVKFDNLLDIKTGEVLIYNTKLYVPDVHKLARIREMAQQSAKFWKTVMCKDDCGIFDNDADFCV